VYFSAISRQKNLDKFGAISSVVHNFVGGVENRPPGRPGGLQKQDLEIVQIAKSGLGGPDLAGVEADQSPAFGRLEAGQQAV